MAHVHLFSGSSNLDGINEKATQNNRSLYISSVMINWHDELSLITLCGKLLIVCHPISIQLVVREAHKLVVPIL